MCKRPLQDSGANGNKRQRLPGDDSEIIESEESEALPENYAGETKESDVDRRGRLKKERKQKKIEDAAERERQGHAKISASRSKPCLANIGGKRVKKNGIMTFEGGKTFGPYPTKQEAEEATGILKKTIGNNILNKGQSKGKKGKFEGQKVMFINAPVDTSDKVPCGVCGNRYSTKEHMFYHVRQKHPGVLPPAPKIIKMPEEYKTFTPPITKKQYAFIVERVGSNIKGDLRKCDLKPKLMALVEGFKIPWGSTNIKGAAEKYHFTEQQIRDSIDNKESLIIEKGRHVLKLGLGKTKDIQLAGRTVTFSWKYKVSEEDKIKLLAMKNRETYHMIARQNCEYMNAKGMFASEDVIDDNGGLIRHGFVFEPHGGLFAPSFDRIEDEYTVNGQTFYKLHYTNPENALKNIHVVALLANVRYKASTAKIQEKVTDFENKSVEQRQKEFEEVLKISKKKNHNGKRTPLYSHANATWTNDKQCQGAFATYQAYWRHLLVLLKKQKGLCAVAKIPMSLESGLWKMSGDAIDPKKGHVPDNLRLVCFYNNTIDCSKTDPNPNNTNETSLNTIIHDEYWRIVR